MAGVNVQQAPTTTTETEGNNVKQGRRRRSSGGDDEDDANQPRVHSNEKGASASSSSSSGLSRRASSRRPDGTSKETGPSDLRSLEQALRRESIVDVVEIGPMTVPSTPVRDSVDGVGNDVRVNLELASVKLSKLAPED